ncbi:MAG: hypothetical protein WD598_18060 [Acidimicrobiia bacterium]
MKGVLAVLVVGAGAATVLSDGGSDRPGVEVISPVVARNMTARASIALSSGWRELDLASTTDPAQVLVVGTAPRPENDPIDACDASIPAGSGFVSVYEYLTGARLNSPDHQRVYDTTQFVSRPPDFADVAPPGTGSCTDGGQFADFTFLDGGRFFLARVVATADPDGERFQDAITVLNALEIAVPPDVTSTTAPGVTSTTAVTAEEEDVARQQVTDALRGAFGGGGPLTGDEAVVGGFPLGPVAAKAAAKGNESFIGVIVPRVDWLVLDTPTHAAVNFDLLIDAQVITANTTGEALLVEGRWRITEETFCTIVRRGGITCPNR